MRYLLVGVVLGLLIGTAAAQKVASSENASYVKPPTEQFDASQCGALQVKALYAATDTTQTLEEQEKLLNAAEAYGKLHGLGQPC